MLVIPSQTLGGHYGYICIVTLTQSISLRLAKTPCSLSCSASLCVIDQRKETAVILPATKVAQQRVTLAHRCIQHPWVGGCSGSADLSPGRAGWAPVHQTRQASKAAQTCCRFHSSHTLRQEWQLLQRWIQLGAISRKPHLPLESGTCFLSSQERMVLRNTQWMKRTVGGADIGQKVSEEGLNWLTDLVTWAYRALGEVKWQVSACGGTNTLQKGKYTEGKAAQEKSEADSQDEGELLLV